MKGLTIGGSNSLARGLKCTPIEEQTDLYLQGEYGTGGRPLIKKEPNPYLEIDLIDPDDPILF